MKTIITITNNGNSIVYLVRLDPKIGMANEQSYRAEVARVVAMGKTAGAMVVTEES